MCICCHNDQDLDTNNLYDHSLKSSAGVYNGESHTRTGQSNKSEGDKDPYRESAGSTAMESVFDMKHDYDRADHGRHGRGYGHGQYGFSYSNKIGYRPHSDFDGQSVCTVESVLTDMELDYGDGFIVAPAHNNSRDDSDNVDEEDETPLQARVEAQLFI